MRGSRTWHGIAAAIALVLTAAFAPAASAKGLSYLTSKSRDLPAGKVKAATVNCPNGAWAIGGGLTIKGANTATGVHSSYPVDDGDPNLEPGDGWRGVAHSRSAGDKSFRVTAVCSKTGRFTSVRGTTSAPDGMHTEMYAPCDTGQVVTGGGIELPKANPSLLVGGTYPVDIDADTVPDDYWYAVANNLSGAPQTITTHAICAKTGSYQYVEADSSAPGFEQGVAAAECPPGTKVTGGGGSAATSTTSVEIAQSAPYSTDGPGSKPDDGWRTSVNNLAGVPLDITTFAVCRG